MAEVTRTDRPRTRWTEPGTTADDFDREQAQRVHALRAAREVLEDKTNGGPFSGGSAKGSDAEGLIQVAVFIVDGAPGLLVMESSRDEQMLRYRASERSLGIES